jgi:hypothetical protein
VKPVIEKGYKVKPGPLTVSEHSVEDCLSQEDG